MSLGNEPIAKTGLTKEEAEGCGDKFYQGITKREHFAALAMQGLLSSGARWDSIEVMSGDALKAADALLSALEAES